MKVRGVWIIKTSQTNQYNPTNKKRKQSQWLSNKFSKDKFIHLKSIKFSQLEKNKVEQK